MPRPKQPPTPETPVEQLYNLSEKTGGWLREIGISTHGELAQADLCQTWLELRLRNPACTKLMWYALYGAVHNIHWKEVPINEIGHFEQFRAALRKEGNQPFKP